MVVVGVERKAVEPVTNLRRWLVGGALIRHADGLVLVGNRRRDRSLEWTPPGGVIDPGETVLGGLCREVREETGLLVRSWVNRCYTVTVDAPDMGWQLRVEAWEAGTRSGWSGRLSTGSKLSLLARLPLQISRISPSRPRKS